MIDTKRIRTIIFDFGGVLIDVDMSKVVSYLLQTSYPKMDILTSSENMEYTFGKLERGIISTEVCFNRIRKITGANIPDEELIFAWNTVLGDIPKGRLELLREVRQNYKTILISNTNSVHFEEFMPRLKKQCGCGGFEDLFDAAYFSHHIHLSKPNPEIFEYVMSQEKLEPKETIFIDDLLANVQAAETVGIQAVHLDLEAGADVRDLFQYGQFRPQIDIQRDYR